VCVYVRMGESGPGLFFVVRALLSYRALVGERRVPSNTFLQKLHEAYSLSSRPSDGTAIVFFSAPHRAKGANDESFPDTVVEAVVLAPSRSWKVARWYSGVRHRFGNGVVREIKIKYLDADY